MNYNVIQYDDCTRPIYAKCREQVQSRLPITVDFKLLTNTECQARCSDYRAVSDVLRIKLAASQPDMVWLDSDILLKKWIDFPLKKGRPYFNDIHTMAVIFVNGCTKFFKTLWNLYNLDETMGKKIGWMQTYVRKHKSEIEILPEGYFVHCCMDQAIFAGKNFNNYGTSEGYNIFKDDKGELQLKVRF
jgi:hypothetical protein